MLGVICLNLVIEACPVEGDAAVFFLMLLQALLDEIWVREMVDAFGLRAFD